MPPPAQSTQPPSQQLSARESGQFKKLMVCYFHLLFIHQYFIICYFNSVFMNKNNIKKV
jgi:hypothetical protein